MCASWAEHPLPSSRSPASIGVLVPGGARPPPSTMLLPLLMLSVVVGFVIGLTAGWYVFSKGKKISLALQAQIN